MSTNAFASRDQDAFCLQVEIRRDRQCVPIKAGRQGELPRGSVTLALSSTKVCANMNVRCLQGT